MMNNKETGTSKMLIEVWKMKEQLFKETENMSCDELFNYINKKTETVILNLKMKTTV